MDRNAGSNFTHNHPHWITSEFDPPGRNRKRHFAWHQFGMSERPTGSSISNLLLTTNNRPIQGKSTKAAEMPLIPPGDKEIDEPEVEKPMTPIDSDQVAVKGLEPGSNVQ